MSWRLGLVDSAWFGSQWHGAPMFQLTREIGFDTIDLFVGYDPAELGEEGRRDLRGLIDAAGLEPWALLCTPLGLADFNDSVRRYHIDRANRVVDLAVELGSSNVMLCPGEYVFQQKLLPVEFEWGRLVDAVREIGKHAHDRNVVIAVELLPFEFAFVNSVEAMVRLLDSVEVEEVTAAIDISHFWLQRIHPEEIGRLKGRIGQVHIADCDGVRHGDLPAGMGNTPFVPYLRALAEAGYAGAASVELEFPSDPTRMLEWVRAAHSGSVAALEEAGVRT
jgi:D-psicose/D-tagatose/L-ribulose 3-epimerase